MRKLVGVARMRLTHALLPLATFVGVCPLRSAERAFRVCPNPGLGFFSAATRLDAPGLATMASGTRCICEICVCG